MPQTFTPSAQPSRYDLLSRILHWIFAVSIIYATAVGYALRLIPPGPTHDFLSRLNASLATLLIPLFMLRLFWRFKRTQPAPPALPPQQARVARGIQNLLYVFIFLSLASGYLMMPDGYMLFGLVHIATPFTKGPIADAMGLIHTLCVTSLTLLFSLHIAGVLLHTFKRHTFVLRRML